MTSMDRSTTISKEDLITGSVTSKDGTRIGFYQLGKGPGVVLLHGAMETSQSHLQLAQALSEDYTVYLPDRRGRGLSGPYGHEYSIREDIEDVDAILDKTGAQDVFGVSSGGVIMLQAALSLPAVQRAAIYEPPLSLSRAEAAAVLRRFDRDMAEGNVAGALVTGMQGAQMGPSIFRALPRWLLISLTKIMMKNQAKKAKSGEITYPDLAPTLHYDFALIVEMSERLDSFKDVPAEVLLLGGSQSPTYLKYALDSLEKILPHVKRIEFPGLDHNGSGNREWGGQPERVAQELRTFFKLPVPVQEGLSGSCSETGRAPLRSLSGAPPPLPRPPHAWSSVLAPPGAAGRW
jgi:pimeloyl-ACP methyl ester carboxylesterase